MTKAKPKLKVEDVESDEQPTKRDQMLTLIARLRDQMQISMGGTPDDVAAVMTEMEKLLAPEEDGDGDETQG